MDSISKATKKRLREAAQEAYRRELDSELQQLFGSFEKWKHGDISPFELSDLIHDFRQGPSRSLYTRYSGRDPLLEVGGAVYRGTLSLGDLPPEVSEHVRPTVETLKRFDQSLNATSDEANNGE